MKGCFLDLLGALLIGSRSEQFRICRVQIETTDGNTYLSDECEPRGEACEDIPLRQIVHAANNPKYRK